MSTPPKESYSWVRRIRRMWIVSLEDCNGFLGMAWLLVTLLLLVFMVAVAFFTDPHEGLIACIIAGGWLLFLSTGSLQTFLLHRYIKCPKCGFNPTRRKSDGKPLRTDVLYARLGAMTECPSCGFTGESETTGV